MTDEITKPNERPTKAAKAKAHVARNKGKYTMASVSAGLIATLQLFGALGPLLCHMPFVKDPAACEAQAQRAREAATQLDVMTLDSGAVLQ